VDYIAEIEGLRVGWILKEDSDASPRWWRTMIGPGCGLAGINNVGQCRALDEAKAQLRAAFDAWLIWARNQSSPVVWFGTT
jgi:hypothetical protein